MTTTNMTTTTDTTATATAKVMKHEHATSRAPLPCINPADCSYRREYKIDMTDADLRAIEVESAFPAAGHKHKYLGYPGTGKLSRKANGELVYTMPAWCKARYPKFVMKPLKARKDKTLQVTIERVTKDIEGNVGATGYKGKYGGRRIADGFVIAAADDHRMLCLKDIPHGDAPPLDMGELSGYKRVELPADMELILERARLGTADWDKYRKTDIVVSAKDQSITVESGIDNDDVRFDETVPAVVDSGLNERVRLNCDYVLPVCGAAGLEMWVKDWACAVVFQGTAADGGVFRYVVMPIRQK